MRRASLIAVLSSLVLVPSAAVPASAAEACAGQDTKPAGKATAAGHVAAITCLINNAREVNGLPALATHPVLTAVAQGHADRMVRKHFFGHAGFHQRVTERYARGSKRSKTAEALAFAGGSLGTPRKIVRAWLRSKIHRPILLGPYVDMGVGVVLRSPKGKKGAATVAAAFGRP